MIPRSVKAPTIPIPFNKLLRVVAIIDGTDLRCNELVDHIRAEHFEVEVTSSFERDVSDDAGVGAYLALVDGDRLGGQFFRKSPAGRWFFKHFGEGIFRNDLCNADVDAFDQIKGRISATLALIYPPGIGVVVPGERWDYRARPMIDYFLAFEESFNRFPGFNYEVQGVFQERREGRIKFHTYVVREQASGYRGGSHDE